jgi:hypothetical protein
MTHRVYFSVEAGPPDTRVRLPGAKPSESLVLYEEAASLWAWAWPKIIGWHFGLEWLFSPVVGQEWPGDLWGIDATGSIVLAETKLARDPQDPMRDFLGYCCPSKAGIRAPLPNVDHLRHRWLRYKEMELRFAEESLALVRAGHDVDATHPGLVPYSRKRLLVRRWITLYEEVILPRVKDRLYTRTVESWLNLRSASRNERVDFVGIFACEDKEVPRLSARGREAAKMLGDEVGLDRIHWRAFSARPRNEKYISIEAWQPELDDA